MPDKHKINRVCTDWLCLQTKGYPTTEMKMMLAKVICEMYPTLKSRTNGSYVSLYHI